jgi:hypothetical protein
MVSIHFWDINIKHSILPYTTDGNDPCIPPYIGLIIYETYPDNTYTFPLMCDASSDSNIHRWFANDRYSYIY